MSKRDALLEAACELLSQRGYSAVSPRDILLRSEAGQGSLYHHFGSKKQLAVAALNQLEADMVALFEHSLECTGDIFSKLELALIVPESACAFARMATDSALADDDLRGPVVRYFRRVRRLVARALEQAAARGEIQLRADAGAIAQALVGAMQGGFLLSQVYRDPAELRATLTTTLLMLRRFTVPVTLSESPALASQARYPPTRTAVKPSVAARYISPVASVGV